MQRLSSTVNVSAVEAAAQAAHRVNQDLFHQMVASPPITVDLKVAGNNAIAMPGGGAEHFIPVAALIICQTATALNADAQLSFGTSAGGQEIMAPFALAGLSIQYESFMVSLTGLFDPIDDNAVLDCTVENADTGTSGTIEVILLGRAR